MRGVGFRAGRPAPGEALDAAGGTTSLHNREGLLGAVRILGHQHQNLHIIPGVPEEIPVSYTHLDVYKRQPLYSGRKI